MSGLYEIVTREEADKDILDFATSKNVAMLAIIAPYVPYRVSPERVVRAELGPPEELGIENFILKAKENGIDKLYLLLHSSGGGVSSAYMIGKALRKNFKEITAFIPQIAASGATLIAITANKIVMGEISRLSPIDVQLWSNDEMRSALALVRSFVKLEKKFERTPIEDISYPYRHLIESIDPEELERMSGILGEVEEYAFEFLSKAGYPEDKAREIAEKLVYGFHSHYEVIDFDKAKKLGLNVEWYENRKDEWDIMRKWLGKYLLEEAPIHHIVYAFPRRGKEHGKEGNK